MTNDHIDRLYATPRLSIGVDIDGVLYDFVAAMARYISSRTGRPVESFPPATVWKFFEEWGMTNEEWMGYFRDGINAGYVYLDGPPVVGALDVLNTIHHAGHSIHLVTARAIPGAEDMAKKNTYEWFARHHLPYDTMTFDSDKTAVRVDIFLDDKPKNVAAVRSAGMVGVIFDQAWNRDHEFGDGRHWPRVKSWPEFGHFVQQFFVARV